MRPGVSARELTLATDRCHILDDPWGDRAIAVKFDRIAESLDALRGLRCDGSRRWATGRRCSRRRPRWRSGSHSISPAAARAGTTSTLARSLFAGEAAGAGVLPGGRDAADAEPRAVSVRAEAARALGEPGRDPRQQSGGVSRGVRAHPRRWASDDIQVESYIPGREFAIEGLVTHGHLQPLAIFDKPDPLEGPYFEETIYMTPSRAAGSGAAGLIETAAQAARALGLRHGPVHAELRYNEDGAWILEAHARPIGGLCAKRCGSTAACRSRN